MKTYLRILCLLITVGIIYSCASGGNDYGYESGALNFYLKGDQNLNLYQGTPHTLVICAYQLSNPNMFNQLADDREGLSKLLDCNHFDQSVAYTKRLVLQPGEEVRETLDRAEGAKYVGLIAGYYKLHKGNTVRLYRFPVGSISRKVGNLSIEMYLGPQAIQGGKGR